MAMEANKETAAVAARSFLIWGEEFSRKGRYAAAEKLCQRAWGLVERTLGRQHPMMAEVLECYSDLLRRTKRSAEGVAMKKRAERVARTSVAAEARRRVPAETWPEAREAKRRRVPARVQAALGPATAARPAVAARSAVAARPAMAAWHPRHG